MTMIKSSPILELKSIDDAGTFSGYASIWDHTDSHMDRVIKGAFKKSLAEHKRKGSAPKLFWQHRQDEPLGRWTLVQEDDVGLYVEGKLNMGVRRAREAHALLRERDIDGLSIGYWPEDVAESKTHPGTMEVRAVRLVEVSIVSAPSNDRALVSEVRAEIERAADFSVMRQKLVAGEPLTIREVERGMREAFSLSNSEAERAVALLKSLGDPVKPQEPSPELAALLELRAAFGDFITTK